MIVNNDPDMKSAGSIMSPEPANAKGTPPAYSPLPLHNTMRPTSSRSVKLRRFVKFSILAATTIFLMHRLFHHHLLSFGFHRDTDMATEDVHFDVTDIWVRGAWDYDWQIESADFGDHIRAVTGSTIGSTWMLDGVPRHASGAPQAPEEPEEPNTSDAPDRPDGPTHHGSPRKPSAPGKPTPPKRPHGPPRGPPKGTPRHGHPRGPHGPHGPTGPHPPSARPKHHVTIECATQEEATMMTLDIPYTPDPDLQHDFDAELPLLAEPISFHLPSSLPRLVLASQGPVVGSVEISESENVGDEVHIYVTLSDPHAKICQLKHADTVFGVAVAADRHLYPPVHAKIDVYFPSSLNTSINAFSTHMGIFKHNVHNMPGVSFGRFELGASNTAIDVERVNAKFVSLTTSNAHVGCRTDAVGAVLSTSNGAIVGTFPNVTETLVLKTTNAPITFDATLFNESPKGHEEEGEHVPSEGKSTSRWRGRKGEGKRGARKGREGGGKGRKEGRKGGKGCGGKGVDRPLHGPHHRDSMSTSVRAITTNNAVEGVVSLLSNSSGKFDVIASTKNGPISLSFLEQSANSTLGLVADTTNSRAKVSLHPAYEGGFMLRTSNAQPFVKELSDAKDPSGLDRNRTVEVETKGRVVFGSAYWGEKKKAGTVVVSSTNAPVSLEV